MRNANTVRFQAEFVSETRSGKGTGKETAVGSCATRWGVGLEHPMDAG